MAGALRTRSAQLFDDGWLDRSVRLLDRADARCPGQAQEGAELRQRVAGELARGGDPRTLLAKAAQHVAAAEPREARRAFALAALGLERALGTPARADTMLSRAVPLEFTPDGKTLLAIRDGGVVLLDTATLTPQGYIDTADAPTHARFSHDGALLALVTHRAPGISVIDVASLSVRRTLTWAGESPVDVQFAPRSKHLVVAASARFDVSVRKFDLATGESVAAHTAVRAGSAAALAVSADGTAVAVGTDRGVIELLDGSDLSLRRRLVEPGTDEVSKLAFSARGDAVASRSRNGVLQIWDRATGKARLTHKLDRSFSSSVLAFTASDERLLVLGGSFAEELHVIDVKTGTTRKSHAVRGAHVVLAPDARHAALASREGGLHVVAFEDGRTLADARRAPADLRDAVIGEDRLVIALDRQRTSGGSEIRLWDFDPTAGQPSGHVVPGYQARLALSPAGGWLAGSFGHGSVRAWPRGGPAEEWPRSKINPDRVAIDDRGRVVIAGGPFELGIERALPQGEWTRVFHRAERHQLDMTTKHALVAEKGGLRPVNFGGPSTPAFPGLTEVRALALAGDGSVAFAISKEGLSRIDIAHGVVKRITPQCEGRSVRASADGSVFLAQCNYETWLLSAGGKEQRLTRRGEGAAVSPSGRRFAWLERHDVEVVAVPSLDSQFTLELWSHPEAVVARGPKDRVELVSDPETLSAVYDRLGCRIEDRGYPFEVCADRVLDDGLVVDALVAR